MLLQHFLKFPFAWNILFQALTFSLYVSLGMKCMYCRQHLYGSCFCFHSTQEKTGVPLSPLMLQPPLRPLLQTVASTAHPAYGATPCLSPLEVPLILFPARTLASRSKLPLVLQPKGLELSRWLFKEIASFPVLCPEALISGHQQHGYFVPLSLGMFCCSHFNPLILGPR